MRTLEEVLKEVMEIVNTTQETEARLQRLKSFGYHIEYNWVKNGSIGDVYYMKRKQVYRIQIAPSERCGSYDKAFCIVIPSASISIHLTETIKIRNMSASKKQVKDGRGQINRNNMIKNKI
jgi:hypothetical protein